MNIIEIVKDAFIFPSKNIRRFAIYLLLSLLMIGFALGGIFTYAFGIFDGENYLMGGIYLIVSMLFGFIICGYHLKIIRSGIEHDDDVPVFEFFNDFMTGFDNFVVLIFYFLIPTLIVALIGLDTNLFSNFIDIFREFILEAYNVFIMGTSIISAVNALSLAITNFVTSLAITVTAAFVLFAIFSIIYAIAEARLANTGSLSEALNIFESIKDIKRIGAFKVVLLILLIVVIVAIIEILLLGVLSYLSLLFSILIVIITPYLVLFCQRALGLLYSDIV